MNRLLNLQKNLINSNKNDFIDFQDAYNRGTIDQEQMGRLVFGPNYSQRLKTFQLIKSHPQLYEHYHLTQASRTWQRQKSVEIMFKTHQLLNVTYEEYLKDPNKLSLVCSSYVAYDYGYSVKSGVHYFLYGRAIINLGTQKHFKFFLRAINYQDVGCFALTQLTHGSNVKGIQTQAHYDHATKSYIMHTPSKDAMKFWIGAAANVANMAVIWANLYLDGKNYGIHAFIVPIRCPKTHKLFTGVLIGDCGPKTGLNAIDNGFIMFDHYRIPKQNQLDKISGVDQNGMFFSTIQGEQKRFGLHLAALSGGRFMISMNCGIISLTALTIGIRYTCIRKQFSKDPKKTDQDLIINYPLTKRRMMPLLAQAIVYNTGNFSQLLKWDQNYENILNPKNLIIQELHFISSALKPKTSWLANQCVRQSRQMMGGHGYSTFSKLGVLINDNEINSTWEGDNNVLLQQTIKIILQNMQRTMKGKQIQINILKFLQNPPDWQSVEFNQQNARNLEWARTFFQYKISSKLQEMAMKMMALKQQKVSLFDIWNKSQVFLGKTISLALGDLYYLQTMLQKISLAIHPSNKSTLSLITQVWILKCYKQDQLIDDKYHSMIQALMMELCQKLSNESLKLLQSLSADDQVIGSPFADPKGKGFEKYMAMVEKLNQNRQKPKWYKQYLERQSSN